jgi:8-oxo-dGTP diphosphatase
MAGPEILAAGGIVVRGIRKPLIAVVQRRKDDKWFLPKGKLKRREKAIAAARREVMEETGHDVEVHEFLGAISYEVRGKPKLVQFWRMQAAVGPTRELTDDIKAVDWLPLQAAIGRLEHPLERLFLRNVGRCALDRVAPAPRAAPPALVVPPPELTPVVAEPGPVAEPEPIMEQEPAVTAPMIVVAEPNTDLSQLIETIERPPLFQRILQRLW